MLERFLQDVATQIDTAVTLVKLMPVVLYPTQLMMQAKEQYQVGQYEKAILSSQQAWAISREMAERTIQGLALNGIGESYRNLGKYDQARKYFEYSLAIAKELRTPVPEQATPNNISEVDNNIREEIYNNLHQHFKTWESFEQVLDNARRFRTSGRNMVVEPLVPFMEAGILNNLGIVNIHLGEYDRALKSFEPALKSLKEFYAHPASIVSELLIKMFLNNLGQTTRSGEGKLLNNIGGVYYRNREYLKALDYLQQALPLIREGSDRPMEAMTLHNIGGVHFRSGNLAEAESLLREAVEVLESLRIGLKDVDKVSIFDTQVDSYRLLQEILIARDKPRPALEIAERGRARAFVELLAESLSSQPTAQSAPNPLNLQEIQQIAQAQNSILVEYSIIYDEPGKESNLFIWVIKPTGEIAFRPVALKPLQHQQNISLSELVFQARRSLGVEENQRDATLRGSDEILQPIRHISEPLRQLHQYLIEPIADLLPTNPNAHVIFIPQGSLFLVPFPALQDKEGKFLIEHHTILTAPSIQTLELTRQQRQRVGTIHKSPLQSQDVLVVGNPTMPTIPLTEPPKPLNPLPGAEAEAIAIASLLNTQAIIGDKATKVYIEKLLPTARLIHLATHGLLDDIKQLGVPGAIALAPSGKDNGFLTAGEIYEMKLNAELVVLSACHSGQGKITGDGVVGLSRCLFAAGVPSVIVSLWSVGDDSTQFLMSEFYQNLQNGMNKAQALRQAMLTTIADYSEEPQYWAAFTLLGEAE
jgi:CHAT domain-containing protein